MKKLLITGSSGMLGSNIVYELGKSYEIFGAYKSCPNTEVKSRIKADLVDFRKTKAMADSICPDFVVHCAALTNVELCEKNLELARATNALATRNLVSSLNPRTRFIYISTDSVFDGEKGDYTEEDTPLPLNNYAKTKLEGERFVEQVSKNYVIIRTNMFGWNRTKKGESFAEWVYNSLTQDKQINMFTDVIFNPVTVNALALFIDKLLRIDFMGRLNIGSMDSISKYDFGLFLAGVFNFNTSLITPVSIDSFKFNARRPKNTSLNTTLAKKILGDLPAIKGELKKFYEKKKI